MEQKIKDAYDNLFMSINNAKNETLLASDEILVGLFVDNYEPTIAPGGDWDEWTEMRVVLRSAIINRKRWLQKQMQDHINSSMIVEGIDEGMIAQQFNEK